MDCYKDLEAYHFLDKTETAMLGCMGEYYPVYISVSKGQDTISVLSRIGHYLRPYSSDAELLVDKDPYSSKLLLEGFLSESLMKKSKSNNLFPLTSLLEQELEIVKKTAMIETRSTEKLYDNSFARTYARYSSDIAERLDRIIKDAFYNKLEQIFESYVNSQNDQRAYKTANYFLHYINWNNTFKDIYERSYEIMPGDIKHIEKYFSTELYTAVRAYLALLPSLNILRQKFSSRNEGKITALAYIDWLSNIRELVHDIFFEYFGDRLADEYLKCLDGLLENDSVKKAV